MRILVKEPGKPTEIKETNEKYMADSGRPFIPDGDIRHFILYDTVCFLYDDEACFKDLETNFILFNPRLAIPVQEIRGTVVGCKLKPVNPLEEIWDYEITDLSDEDIENVTEIFSIEDAEKLEAYIRKLLKEKR